MIKAVGSGASPGLPRIGYSGQGYHTQPHHSQYKVRIPVSSLIHLCSNLRQIYSRNTSGIPPEVWRWCFETSLSRFKMSGTDSQKVLRVVSLNHMLIDNLFVDSFSYK